MKRLLSILHLTCFTMVLFSMSMLIPAGVAAYMGDGTLDPFLEGFALALVLGLIPYLLTRQYRSELQPRDGFLLVSLVWTVLPALATIPFLIYFRDAGTPISFSFAYFEAMSGITTTGGTVLVGLDHLPASIHIWRATLIWLGSMGILVLAVAVLPSLGVGGSQVVRAETPGPMKDEKLTPRIAGTAKALYAIFLGLSLLCWGAYYLAGLRGTDAFVHMAATVGLGGFSTRDASIGGFDSFAVELVAMIFMLIAAINFATHFKVWRTRSLHGYRVCPETRYFLLIMLATGLVVSLFLYARGIYPDAWTAFRYGFFNTISVGTTTGFASTDYASWPVFAPLLMLFISCFAASSGSTGGGLKLIRIVLIFKQVRYEMLRLVHPRAVSPIKLSQRIVDTRVLQAILAFLALYLLVLVVITLLLLVSGLDTLTAFTAALSSLNNTGPGLGAVGPAGSFAEMTTLQIWLCSFGMLLGRLELFTVLVLFTPTFWRK
jgi:trk system potassium uptake protein TrkH